MLSCSAITYSKKWSFSILVLHAGLLKKKKPDILKPKMSCTDADQIFLRSIEMTDTSDVGRWFLTWSKNLKTASMSDTEDLHDSEEISLNYQVKL